nr:hypothetical protein [Fundidesulfovibrio soli]
MRAVLVLSVVALEPGEQQAQRQGRHHDQGGDGRLRYAKVMRHSKAGQGRREGLRGYDCAGREEIKPDEFEKEADAQAYGEVARYRAPEEAHGQGPVKQGQVDQEAEAGKEGKKKALATT